MAVKTLPQVPLLGETTAGAHSDILFRTLSNGWVVGLSFESYILPDGKLYEKTGLAPHISMPFKGGLIKQDRHDILERAISMGVNWDELLFRLGK